ncbi:hypothetical protein [Streptomyces sp. NBC_00872]|uniref:hypothetical protein n=1 Tax=Streptomyces sp. NBC_00872 TaxID=2903686 RepID=UPI003869D752|nr:hypothetical protein OG214_04185 [Streptomyces sp. NBC_00872]
MNELLTGPRRRIDGVVSFARPGAHWPEADATRPGTIHQAATPCALSFGLMKGVAPEVHLADTPEVSPTASACCLSMKPVAVNLLNVCLKDVAQFVIALRDLQAQCGGNLSVRRCQFGVTCGEKGREQRLVLGRLPFDSDEDVDPFCGGHSRQGRAELLLQLAPGGDLLFSCGLQQGPTN